MLSRVAYHHHHYSDKIEIEIMMERISISRQVAAPTSLPPAHANQALIWPNTGRSLSSSQIATLGSDKCQGSRQEQGEEINW